MTRKQAVDEVFRNLRRKIFLQYHFQSIAADTKKRHPFSGPSSWDPLVPQNKKLNKYLDSVEKKVIKHALYSRPSKGWIYSNATSILTQMDKEPGWIIKSADKGCAVVLWGRDSYIKEADRQLSDIQFCEPADSADNDLLLRELISFIEASFKRGAIDETTKNFLMPALPTRTPLFYPKSKRKEYLVYIYLYLHISCLQGTEEQYQYSVQK